MFKLYNIEKSGYEGVLVKSVDRRKRLTCLTVLPILVPTEPLAEPDRSFPPGAG